MKENYLTQKQFAALIFTSLLSPLLRSVPRASVLIAGRGVWISMIPALLLLLALVAFLSVLIRQLRPGEGFADLFLRWMGPVTGRIVLILYGIWFLLYAGFVLRSGAARLVAAVYPESPIFPFLITMLGLCLLAALGTVRALGRTAFLLQSFLLTALALILLSAAPNISLNNLLPVPLDNVSGILLSSLPFAAMGSLGACFPFLLGYSQPIKEPGRQSVPLVLGFVFIGLILCLEVIGTFGPGLTAKLSFPFFLMVRDISVFRITQRIEAVVVVLWIFADFILCTAMLRCTYAILKTVFSLPEPDNEKIFSLRNGRWLLLAEALLVLASGYFISRSSFETAELSDRVIPLIGACTIYIGMPLCWFIGFVRGKTQKPA